MFIAFIILQFCLWSLLLLIKPKRKPLSYVCSNMNLKN